MVRRALLTLACVLAVTLPGFAQEQTGTVAGTVKDSTGAVLPGVTVEIVSVDRGNVNVASTTTDSVGVYRFPGLVPGKYEVKGTLQSFTPGGVKGIDLRLGQILTVDFALSVGGTAESVQVTAESPIVDAKQSARGDEHPRRADRAGAARPRLHVARHAGARRQPGSQAGRHLDRRRERRREPLHRRRHRDDQPAERPLGQERHRRTSSKKSR